MSQLSNYLRPDFTLIAFGFPFLCQNKSELHCLTLSEPLLLVAMEEDVSLACFWALNEAIVFLPTPALDHTGELSKLASRFVDLESPCPTTATFAPRFSVLAPRAPSAATQCLHKGRHKVA